MQIHMHYYFKRIKYFAETASLAQNTAATANPTLDLCTRDPILLGGQRQCRFKGYLHVTYATGIEPQTPRSRVQCLNLQTLHIHFKTIRGKLIFSLYNRVLASKNQLIMALENEIYVVNLSIFLIMAQDPNSTNHIYVHYVSIFNKYYLGFLSLCF